MHTDLKFKTYAIIALLSVFSLNGMAQYSLQWKYTTQSGIYSSPVVDGNAVFVGSNDSCIYSLNALEGKLNWKFKTSGEIKSKPLVYKGNLIFNSTDGFIYSINKRTARQNWKVQTAGEKRLDIWDYYLSSPVFAHNKVIVGSGDGCIYALNPQSGNLCWKFQTGGIVHATPLVVHDKVFVGSFDGYFYALNLSDGSLIWKFKTKGNKYFPIGEIQKGATLYNQSVVFGCRDYFMYSLNIESGKLNWSKEENNSWIIAAPLLVDGLLCYGTSDSHHFQLMTAATGEIKKTFSLNMRVYAEAILLRNQVLFGCFNGKLYQVDLASNTIREVFQTDGSKRNYHSVYNEDGTFRADFKLYGNDYVASEKQILGLGSILSTPCIANGMIYLGDSNGCFYALRLSVP